MLRALPHRCGRLAPRHVAGRTVLARSLCAKGSDKRRETIFERNDRLREESEAKLRELQPDETVWFPDDETPSNWKKRSRQEDWLGCDGGATSVDDLDKFQDIAPHSNIKRYARPDRNPANSNPKPESRGFWDSGFPKTRQSIGSSGSMNLYGNFTPIQTKKTATVWRI